MPTVLSLKKLRDSNTLKDQIKKLEDEKAELTRQLELQKKLEAKLREDILSHKKDFEHLEKQFDHFAGIEAEYEALQTEIQLERLENLDARDREENKYKAQIKKARDEIKQVQDELKSLKQLDPLRLKKQVVDLKKKAADQSKENKSLNTALLSIRKELKEAVAERDTLKAEIEAARNGTDQFWQSADGVWNLYESELTLKGEDADTGKRVRCLNTETGIATITTGLGEDELALWSGDLEVPEIVSKEAGKRLKLIKTESEDED